VVAEDSVGGVHRSPGAAITDCGDAPVYLRTPTPSNIAAPEDGRTPVPSPPLPPTQRMQPESARASRRVCSLWRVRSK